ncbi:hypothetical protein Dvina_50370 [Dactylosporangium vinaceum]|uniref:DUF3592 domain-containing protein n=1 Tax=Dactylosporangium vinaceum TaxID=53362 RepID=A0ABV5M567_9ACTN|nr:hypothetical protein [Dactylosporangium vinaceum]UAB96071.1 hypothetical protein Dvina_50370 [Dactylosporangium vinaceum]
MLIMALVWAAGLVLAGWRTIDDARGATVDAEVVGITTNVPGRRVYDVRFATPAGQACESRVDSGSKPPPREIHVGGRALVHYSASDPCSSFLLRETTSLAPWPFTIVASVSMVACLTVAWRRHRNRGEPPSRAPR